MNAVNLRRFDSFTPAEIRALPGRLRRAVQADRKAIVTAELQQNVAARA